MIKKIIDKVKYYLDAPKRKATLRENMRRNFIPKEDEQSVGPESMNARIQSMKDSQGKSDFSGSGYNGPGNPDHDKITSNKPRHDFMRN